MPKKPMPSTASPLPVPPLTPALAQEPQPEMAYLVDPSTEPATVIPDPVQVSAAIEAIATPTEKAAEALTEVGVEPVTLVVQPSPSATRLARLIPAKGFPIRHFNGGIVFYPGVPSAEIPVDAWLENQIKRGTLVEV